METCRNPGGSIQEDSQGPLHHELIGWGPALIGYNRPAIECVRRHDLETYSHDAWFAVATARPHRNQGCEGDKYISIAMTSLNSLKSWEAYS